nr:putative RNA-directed DNA polymerase, eukaryota, reverse transcriptase zinc-binding domain protein [Tanacetum cinerariifolium]
MASESASPSTATGVGTEEPESESGATVYDSRWECFQVFGKKKEIMFSVLSRMAIDLISVQASSVASESAFLTSGRVLSIRRTRLTPASLEMCMCLKDHLDAKERKQDKCPLEIPLDFEEDVFDDEVQRNEAIPLSDEEIALDASSEGTMFPGGPRKTLLFGLITMKNEKLYCKYVCIVLLCLTGSKRSKLDQFLVFEGIFSIFPSITAVCLDRHLSDHRPIILCEVQVDFGLIPFRFYHSWISLEGFDAMVEQTWRSFSHNDANKMIRFKKKDSGPQGFWMVGDVSDSNLLWRSELHRNLYNINQMESKEYLQKPKIKWAIEGDENSKFFHGLINKKRSQLAIRGVFVDGIWCTNPNMVKEAFFKHFEARFKKPVNHRLKINFLFSKRLSDVQASDLERRVSRDEIWLAIWNCGENKSPSPDGYSFEFLGNIRTLLALIYIMDAKFVNDFRPISLIGSVYKVVTKVLANRLALVISDPISDTQSAFVANRNILDESFILNELLHWCKRKKKQVMFFKADFAKAYDSVRWDYLPDVLKAFGFGNIWCKWIRETFSSAKALVLVNGSLTIEFPFHCGLKQGDPLSPYLFILIMESLNMSFIRAIDEGFFKGVHLHGSTSISYLFYADDVMVIGEWSDDNLKGIINILQCFFLASGLKINIQKSQVLGVGVPSSIVMQTASSIGCGVLYRQFRYLGVMVGECMSRHNAWASTVDKLRSRLSKWNVKTLFIGGRLTLLKAVLGAPPLYNMSIFKVPKGILNSMEAIRNGSLWFRVIKALYGTSIDSHPVNLSSNWCSIIRELHLLVGKGFHFLDRCKKQVGNDRDTCFWYDNWLGDKPLKYLFPRLFALELNKEVTVADKVQGVVSSSFRRPLRAGSEYQHLTDLNLLMESVSLSHSCDRWICDLSGDGQFRVKEGTVLFNEMPPRRSVLFDDIVYLSFNWFSSRCNRAIT